MLPLSIIQTLQNKGFQAYLVGGGVRDLLLNRDPKDYDIATNATPEEVQSLFPDTKPVGKSFGVILVFEQEEAFEVATFRTDGDYQDGRRPESVHFSSAEEDASRRDFTINAIFYDPITQEFHDYVEGQKDLKRGLLRFIGDPHKRINEDFLRILRAVRFKSRFSLAYHQKTREALSKHASLVVDIAAERIYEELTKMLSSETREESFRDLFELGVLGKIFPKSEDLANTPQPKDHHSEGDVLTHTLLVLKNMPSNEDISLYWAAFFHDFAKSWTRTWDGQKWSYPSHDQEVIPWAKEKMNQLSFPKKISKKVLWLLEHKPIFESFDEMRMSKKFTYFDHLWFEDLWKLEYADMVGSIAEDKDQKKIALRKLNLILNNWKYTHEQRLLPSYMREFFTGDEIASIKNIEKGPIIGALKEALRIKQIEGDINTKEEAEIFIKNYS